MMLKRRFAALLVLFVFIVFYSVLHYYIFQKPVLDHLEKYKGEPVSIKAEIRSASSLAFMSAFDLRVFEINGEKIGKFSLRLNIYGEVGADYREIDHILETYVILKSLEDDLPSWQTADYNKSNGYYISAEHAPQSILTPYKITPPGSRSLHYYLEAIRRYAGNIFFANIKAAPGDYKTPEAAAAYGIFTGNKDHISQSVRNDFRRSGMAHVLAVSGMHLAILCGVMSAFMRFFKLHKKIICITIILFCLVFMAFTGFSVSVMRAGLMMILFYTAFLIGRKSDPLTSLFIAGAFILLLNPNNIFDIGFRLSFTATLGIILTSDFNNRVMARLGKIKILKLFVSAFIVTISSTVLTLPVLAYSFGALSLISPVTNLIAAPLITAILFLSLCIMIFSPLSFILPLFGVPVYFITKLLLDITNYFGSLKYSYISVESTNGTGFYALSVVLFVLIILCFMINRSQKKWIPRAAAAAVLIIMAGTLIYPRILFKDSIRFAYYSDHRNQNIIIFGSNYDSVDIIDMTHGNMAHIRPVYDIIMQNGAMYINSIMLTDYRRRHVQMIRRYLNYSEINKVYIPAPAGAYDAEVLNMLYLLSESAGFELINYGSSLKSDDVLISVTNFDHNRMLHTTIEIELEKAKLLYLAIGYKEGYERYTEIKNHVYDVVFYGTHKHNFRDDDYVSDIAASYAGVLSSYLDNDGNITTQKLGVSAVEAYLSGALLFLSDDHGSVVFEIKKDGEIRHYLR
jgi:competence protein ComEC